MIGCKLFEKPEKLLSLSICISAILHIYCAWKECASLSVLEITLAFFFMPNEAVKAAVVHSFSTESSKITQITSSSHIFYHFKKVC